MSGSWYGDSGGGSPNWEQATRLFNNAIATSAPNGTERISSRMARNYTRTLLNSIIGGDVLQLSRSSLATAYEHSLYVTDNNYSGNFVGIYVSAHTADCFNRKLSDVIAGKYWGGLDKVYMRTIKFSAATGLKV